MELTQNPSLKEILVDFSLARNGRDSERMEQLINSCKQRGSSFAAIELQRIRSEVEHEEQYE